MALKAGRVGVAKDQVDEFGKIIGGGSPSGDYYTKTQADNKFETKTHVNNTFQKKTLDVPIEMLSGTKLTVETALEGLNTEKQNTGVVSELTLNTYTSAVHSGAGNKITRLGNMVTLCTALDVHNVSQWTTNIATVPEGFRPPYRMRFPCLKGIDAFSFDMRADGTISLPEAIGSTSVELWISVSYLVND